MKPIQHPANAPQFITVPNTGIQILRQLSISHLPADILESIWKAAKQITEKSPGSNPILPLLRKKNIACDPNLNLDIDGNGWIACSQQDAVFFRVTRLGSNYAMDMVIDTCSGAGHTVGNRTSCIVDTGGWLRSQRNLLAEFFVEPNNKPRNIVGSLIMDFGNTSTSLIFAPVGSPPQEARPIKLQNPFDPRFSDELTRPSKDASLLKSTTFMLFVPQANRGEPWMVMGKRADELIADNDALITSLFAKKVRSTLDRRDESYGTDDTLSRIGWAT